eukprot:1155320-Pelagomonas_calceolata.AAC.4
MGASCWIYLALSLLVGPAALREEAKRRAVQAGEEQSKKKQEEPRNEFRGGEWELLILHPPIGSKCEWWRKRQGWLTLAQHPCGRACNRVQSAFLKKAA